MYINMRVEQIVPAIAEEASGLSYSVPSLCRGLAANGVDDGLHVLSPVLQLTEDFKVAAYSRHTFPLPRFGHSPEMLGGLIEGKWCGNTNASM